MAKRVEALSPLRIRKGLFHGGWDIFQCCGIRSHRRILSTRNTVNYPANSRFIGGESVREENLNDSKYLRVGMGV